MHPPADHRCQIYGNNSVRCVNHGTHWVSWGRCEHTDDNHGFDGRATCVSDFHSWECDGPHLHGEADTTSLPVKQEAA
jgi:hypothetical protein